MAPFAQISEWTEGASARGAVTGLFGFHSLDMGAWIDLQSIRFQQPNE